MLFVRHRGRGIGSLLTRHAIEQQGVSGVDVNEENPDALGFVIVGRRTTDSEGRPHPVIQMKLK